MKIRVLGLNGPGTRFPDLAHSETCYENVHVGIQKGKEVVEPFPGDASKARWEFEAKLVEKDAGLDLRGEFIQGRPGERFIYLSWGVLGPGGGFEMFRRAKLMLAPVDEDIMRKAEGEGSVLIAEVPLTADDGSPVCAALRPPRVQWSLSKN